MKLCSIASGSSGNCIYVGTDATHLLVDAGISGKRTETGLNSIGRSLNQIDGCEDSNYKERYRYRPTGCLQGV